jgi:lipoprotein-anchoring transpeptidase ErfK/SrfK
VRRFTSAALSLATLVPVVGVFVAVSLTPSSAHALPVFEFASAKGPMRVSAADLGVRQTGHGLVIDDEAFAKAIAMLQARFRRPATPGTYELKPDHRVLLRPGAPGYELDPAGTKQMLLRALRGSRSNLRLPTRAIKAGAAPDHAIVVNLQKFRLDLYNGPALQEHFEVGVGALSFPTPPGAYYVRSKAMNPTWRNPGSSWARGMPAYIGPGPRNPLGTRALRLDRGALVIHGTPQPWSVGHRSSHGCIRMRRADIEHLYDLVPEQTPVFIVP